VRDTPDEDGTTREGDEEVARPAGLPVGEVVDLTPPAQVAREALNRARAAARAKGIRPGQPSRRVLADPPPSTGARPGGRDPQTFGAVVQRLLHERGWVQDVSVGGVIGRWREVVGDQVADHCEPETFEDKVLVVRADSTAWPPPVRRSTTLWRTLWRTCPQGLRIRCFGHLPGRMERSFRVPPRAPSGALREPEPMSRAAILPSG